ncbi:uncharacterized protein [Ptychodera flava]|uniref:uncharacterized protein n=1 Tax=Ptychodera flava TaxID=63121 RepID=UPI00396A8A84
MSQPAPPVQQPQMDNDTPSYTYLSNSWTSSVSESHDTSSFISKCTPSEDSSTSSQSANGPSMRQLLFDEELDESTSDIYRMAMNTVNEVDMVHAPAPFPSTSVNSVQSKSKGKDNAFIKIPVPPPECSNCMNYWKDLFSSLFGFQEQGPTLYTTVPSQDTCTKFKSLSPDDIGSKGKATNYESTMIELVPGSKVHVQCVVLNGLLAECHKDSKKLFHK